MGVIGSNFKDSHVSNLFCLGVLLSMFCYFEKLFYYFKIVRLEFDRNLFLLSALKKINTKKLFKIKVIDSKSY